MAVNFNGPIIPCERIGAAAISKLVEQEAATIALEYQAENDARMSSEDRAETKAQFLLHRTNWPLARRVSARHWQALGSDGVTVYDLTQNAETLDWACSCKAPGYCKHQAFRRRSAAMPIRADERLPFDYFSTKREPIKGDELPVQGPRNKLFHDERVA
jgi:hypothetical protein